MKDFTYEELVQGPPLLTPEEFSVIARVHIRTVNNWIRNGDLDAIRLSERIYRIPRAAVVKMCFPGRVKRPPMRTTGPIPRPGRGEGRRAEPRKKHRRVAT